MGLGRSNALLNMKEFIDIGATEGELWSKFFAMMVQNHKSMSVYRRVSTPSRNFQTKLEVYYGPPGTGKSVRANQVDSTAYWLRKPSSSGPLWFDGYDGQQTVVIDEFYGWISIDMFCRMVDRYPLMVETKGGAANFTPRRIIITSNVAPNKWWRFKQPNGPVWAAVQRRLRSPVGTVIYTGVDTPVVADLSVDSTPPEYYSCMEQCGGPDQDPLIPVIKREDGSMKRRRMNRSTGYYDWVTEHAPEPATPSEAASSSSPCGHNHFIGNDGVCEQCGEE